MIQDIVTVFQEVLKQSGLFKVVQGLMSEHDGKLVEYRTKGEGDPIGRKYDLREGVAYFKMNEPVRIERERDLDISSCSPYERRTWLLKVVCVTRRDVLVSDNAYIEDKLAANVISLLSSENWKPLRAQLNAITVASRGDRYEVGAQDGLKINTLELASVAVYIRVEVEASTKCFQYYGCGGGAELRPVIEFTKPVRFTPSGGAYFGFVSVELSSLTDGASIYYTLDGSTPSKNSTLYTGAILINNDNPIRAIAVKDGLLPSAITATAFAILPLEVSFVPAAGEYLSSVLVDLISNSAGGTIHFTLDGSDPTELSPVYSMPILVDVITEIKAIVFNPPAIPSAIAVGQFSIKALTPRASETSGQYINNVFVELFNDNPLGVTQYSTDGGLNWVTDTEFTADVSANYLVRVVDANYITSDSLALNIEIKSAAPTIVPNGGVFEVSQSVTITNNAGGGATTHYTLNGNTPTQSDPTSVPFNLTATTLVKARTFRAGTTPSDVSESQFNKIFRGAVAGAFNGRIYITEDSFVTWSELNVLGLSNQTWVSAHLGTDGSFAQVYTADAIRYSTDILTTWQTPTIPSALVSVFRTTASQSAQKVAIVANIGNGRNQVLVSLDGGATFADRSPNLATFFDVAYSPDGTRLYCSKVGNSVTNVNDDVLYYSDNDGLTWTATYTENIRRVENLVATDAAIYFNIFNSTTDTYIGFHRSTDNGVTRVLRSGAGSLYRRTWISGDDSLIVSASILEANILRISSDQGATWTNFTLPAFVTVIRLTSSYDAVRWMFGTTTRLYASVNSMTSVNQTQPAGNVNRNWQLAATLS